jgi:hypothetical protein
MGSKLITLDSHFSAVAELLFFTMTSFMDNPLKYSKIVLFYVSYDQNLLPISLKFATQYNFLPAKKNLLPK